MVAPIAGAGVSIQSAQNNPLPVFDQIQAMDPTITDKNTVREVVRDVSTPGSKGIQVIPIQPGSGNLVSTVS